MLAETPVGSDGVADPLKRQLAREIIVGTFFERKDDVGQPVERNRAHHMQVRRAIHRQFERQRGQPLHFFGGMARPLRDQFDHGRRKIRISVHRHALKE